MCSPYSLNNQSAFHTNSFSIELWVNPNASQVAYADILGNHGGTNTGFVIQQNGSANNQYYFSYGNTASWLYTSTFNLTPSVYNHLVVAKNGTYTSVYVNGARVTYDNLTASIAPNNNFTMKIGIGYDGGGRYYSGIIPSVKIYNRELSAAEILQNFTAFRGRFGA